LWRHWAHLSFCTSDPLAPVAALDELIARGDMKAVYNKAVLIRNVSGPTVESMTLMQRAASGGHAEAIEAMDHWQAEGDF